MVNGRFEKQSLVVVDKIAPAYAGERNLFSVSLIERNSIEQFSRGHAFLPLVEDHISRGIAVCQYHSGVVRTCAVAKVAVHACAERHDLARFEVYLEAFDVRGLAVVA